MNALDEQIAQVRLYSSLSTRGDVVGFDRALDAIVAQVDSITPSDVCALMRLFRDNVKHHEVMVGLVHVLERAPLAVYIEGFLMALQALTGVADEWLLLIIARIVNSSTTQDELVKQARTAQPSIRRSVEDLLQNAIADGITNAATAYRRVQM